MATSDFKPFSTYVIYGEDTAFGSGATLSASNYFGKNVTFSANLNNNKQRIRGLGEGRNVTASPNGLFEANGSLEGEMISFDWLKYVIGKRQGAGTVGDPYDLVELDDTGFAANQIKSLTVQEGSEGGSNDHAMNYPGLYFNSVTLSWDGPGEPIHFSTDWTSQKASSTTTLTSFTVPSDKVFMGHQVVVSVGSDTVECVSLSFVINNDMDKYGALGDRFIKKPVFKARNYDLTFTIKKRFDDTASVLSATEFLPYFFGAASSPTTSANSTLYDTTVVITEGAATGDRVVTVQLDDVDFDTWGEAVNLGDGWVGVTVTGFARAGITESSDRIPIKWYVI